MEVFDAAQMGTPSIQQPTSPNRTGWCHEVKMTGKWRRLGHQKSVWISTSKKYGLTGETSKNNRI